MSVRGQGQGCEASIKLWVRGSVGVRVSVRVSVRGSVRVRVRV